MKTAGRILGSAAFRAGCTVQDSPVYGAERRGAPVAAYTRISSGPILERGAIEAPDLVVVADDTLLDDPAARPAAGCDRRSTLLVNTTLEAGVLRTRAALEGPIHAVDFTTPVLEQTGTVAGLSTALGVAAAALAGLALDPVLEGLEEELESAGLGAERVRANVRLARTAFETARAWPRVTERRVRPAVPATAGAVVDVPYDPPARAAPVITAVGNTAERPTGSWRQFRPVLDRDRCTRCWLCFVACPEAAIALDSGEYPEIDLRVCKGCLLCAHECPTHAFAVEREAR